MPSKPSDHPKKPTGSRPLLSRVLDSRRSVAIKDAQYRSFIENLPVLFYAVDSKPPYSPFYVSPAFLRFGYPLEDWLTDPNIFVKVIHPDDREWVFQQTKLSTRTGKEVDYEYRMIDAKGKQIWVRDRGCLIRDKRGNVVGREGVMIDITQQKLIEEELRNGEERFRNVIENASDIIYIHDLDGNYLSINQAGERIFGFTRDEALKMNMRDVAVPDQIEIVREHLKKKLKDPSKQTSYEVECIRKDGTRLMLEVNSSAILKNGEPVAIQGIARDITERKRADELIREREQQYRDLFENANDLIYTHDLKGFFTSLNRAGERITGYSREEALSMNIGDVVAPDFLAAAQEMTKRKLNNEASTTYEIDILAKGGRRVSLELSTRLIYRHGAPVGVQGIGRDITERKRSEKALKDSETRYRQLGEGIFHQVWTAEPNGKLDYVNSRTLKYFNKTTREMLGEGWQHVVHPDDLPECIRRWSRCLKTGELYETEFRLRRYDGLYRWHKATATCSRDASGAIVKWFGTNTDIEDQKVTEEKLNYYARHDTLTNLPNRVEFMNQLRAAVERAKENQMARFAVLFLDLDRFKVVNDSLGHVIGDKLLIAISERLKTHVRPGDVVARLGGDEFTILLNRTGGPDEVVNIADRVQRNLSKPFKLDNYEVFTSASIGIIVSDEIMREPEDFLRDADAAMYRAKESGKARYEVFDRDMHVRNMNLLQIETDLRHAVERNEFEVLYQPIVTLATGAIHEFEALLRWRHPVHGLIAPDEFVGVAEETGLIIEIGKWILDQACKQIAKWQKNLSTELSISVNLSAKQLMHPTLTKQVHHALNTSGLRPQQLKLEVTESNVMEHSEKALSVLRELNELGVMLSTDDFGTGYSSLSYLQRFPFDRLKIDRSFIDRMEEDAKSAAIVKTILMLGENLDIEVVAEGIENERQLAHLRTLGCEFGQGYLFSRPAPALEARGMIRDCFDEDLSRAVLDLSETVLEVTRIQ
jgi:diguanylate cyclase (GGDEF)-like protein/PAS domain S-box-containing protein